jgi:hypothetical protein
MSYKLYVDAIFKARETHQTHQRERGGADGTERLLLKGFAEGSMINLEEISEVTNISLNSLKEQADECGFTVASFLAFTSRYIKSLHAKLLKSKPSALEGGCEAYWVKR